MITDYCKIPFYGNKKIVFRWLFLLLSVSVMVFIFFMSSQNGTVSSETSGKLIIKISKLIKTDPSVLSQKGIWSSIQFCVRKSAHFTVYLLLGFFCCGFFSTFYMKPKINFLCSFSVAVLYSASDEFHQSFVEGRSSELTDVLIDTSGAIIGILIFLLVLNIEKGIYLKKKELLKQINLFELKLKEADDMIKSLQEELERSNDRIKFLEKEKVLYEQKNAEQDFDTDCDGADKNIQSQDTEAFETVPEEHFEECIKKDSENKAYDNAVCAVSEMILETEKANITISASEFEFKENDIKSLREISEISKSEIFALLNKDCDEKTKCDCIDEELRNFKKKTSELLKRYY